MANVYVNASLTYGTDTNIRLIELLPGPVRYFGKEPNINCKFHVLSLESAPQYTAISYMWGQDRETSDITLDGEEFAVRINLFKLLQELSHETPGLLWVDAICIDQESIQERNHQVGLMGNIYSQATTVVVWLGHGDKAIMEAIREAERCRHIEYKVDKSGNEVIEGSGNEMKPLGEWWHSAFMRNSLFFNKVAESDDGVVDGSENEEYPSNDFHTGRPSMDILNRHVWRIQLLASSVPEFNKALRELQYFPQPTNKQVLTELSTLCKDPYWSRAWIVQESVLPKHVKIRCGSSQLDIEGLAHQLQYLRNWAGDRKSRTVPGIVATILNSPAAKLLAKRKKWQESQGRSYINPWDSGFDILGCLDVRDRVYAMAALMDPKIAIVPDYNRTPTDVFKDIFEQHLQRTGAFSGTVWNLQAMLELDEKDPVVQRAKEFGSFEWAPLGTLATSSHATSTSHTTSTAGLRE